MSFQKSDRKFQRCAGMSALRRQRMSFDGTHLLQEVTQREPAKVVALKLGCTPRHARNVQRGECATSWPIFLNAAMEYPEVRDFVAQWLGLAQSGDPGADRVLDQIRRMVANLPESGDRE